MTKKEKIHVVALYKFTTLENYTSIKPKLLDVMQKNGVRGTLILAKEGINGTISGKVHSIEIVLKFLNTDPRLKGFDYKTSYSDKHPFLRTKVKLKDEIVTLGVDGVSPNDSAGTYVKPNKWNELVDDPDVLVIDTRNDYEVEIGTFKGSLNPNTDNFRNFPEYFEKELKPNLDKDKKIAMFCTGGIRCEKSTAYLKNQGFDNVYHLEGGILKYLEEVEEKDSTWEGECFVFDERVSVKHGLQKGDYDQCHGCRYPITKEDKETTSYVPGVSCPKCIDKITDKHLVRVKERQKQINLSKDRGENHLGPRN